MLVQETKLPNLDSCFTYLSEANIFLLSLPWTKFEASTQNTQQASFFLANDFSLENLNLWGTFNSYLNFELSLSVMLQVINLKFRQAGR